MLDNIASRNRYSHSLAFYACVKRVLDPPCAQMTEVGPRFPSGLTGISVEWLLSQLPEYNAIPVEWRWSAWLEIALIRLGGYL